MMKRFLFYISFSGMRYCGWQLQKNGITVQEVVEKALKKVLGYGVRTVSCSRTDSGVHAINFCFHVDCEFSGGAENLKNAVNGFLPFDVVVKKTIEVGFNFHSRFCVKAKEYIYIVCGTKEKNPFLYGFIWQYGRTLNLDRINLAIKFFIGKHDFSSFCCSRCDVLDKVRTIYCLEVLKWGDFFIFRIVGDGFLHNMVRIIVGSLVCVSEGLINPESIKDIILKKDRRHRARTVPACGLYLNRVFY